MSHGPTILVVDDGETDLVLMRIAFGKAKCDLPVHEVRNGEEAIAYLDGNGPYCDRVKFPLPSVLLLDLNMPRKDGFAVLSWVRAHPVLRRLSIIIMSASMRPEDISRAYDLGATSFLVKPSHLDALVAMVECLDHWIRINQFPPLSPEKNK